jgi:glycerophosphoryl diester phosphodiesterase
MEVLSHRGWWLEQSQKNTLAAFERSFEAGFGVETDVRDLGGSLVVSHDPPRDGCDGFDALLRLLPKDRVTTLALNVKADGLAAAMRDALAPYASIVRWFVFDMSIPDLLSHVQVGNPVFCRMSEYEREPSCLNHARGVWLDAFDRHWYTESMVLELLSSGKQVCVVSPELHGRDPLPVWRSLKGLGAVDGLMICTDFPERAHLFFGGGDD